MPRYTKQNWKEACDQYCYRGPGRYSVPIKFTNQTRQNRSWVMKVSAAVENNMGKVNRKNKIKRRAEKPIRLAKADRLAILNDPKLKGPRYTTTWVSTTNKEFTVVVKTLIVLRYGRPRDPWGAFMVPKNPAHLFGGTLHPEQQFVTGDPIYDCNPGNPSIKNGILGSDVRQDGTRK